MMSETRDQQAELEQFKRDISLAEYARTRGYRLDRRESSASYVVMRNGDDKVIITRGRQKDYWIYYNPHDSADHGTIIDFIARRGGRTLGTIREELRQWSGMHPQSELPPLPVPLPPAHHDREAVEREYRAAEATGMSPYLENRGLRTETLSCERFRTAWRAERDGRVLFPHRDAHGLTGFERKGRGWTSFAKGGRKSLWRSQSRPEDVRLVLVESAIDAMSYHQLHPDPRTRYASVGGAMSPQQCELVRVAIAEMPSGSTIVLAFDNDDAGHKLAAQVQGMGAADRRFVRHIPPRAKDWNDYLQSRERHQRIAGDQPHRRGMGR